MLALMLLRRGEVVTADWLVDALWGDEPPNRAVGTIRTYIWKLRSALGEDAEITSVQGGYRIKLSRATLDLQEFNELSVIADRQRRSGDLDGALNTLQSALALWE